MCFLLFDSDKEKYILYNKQELGKTSLVKCKSSEHKPGAAWPCGHRAPDPGNYVRSLRNSFKGKIKFMHWNYLLLWSCIANFERNAVLFCREAAKQA